MSKHDNWTPEEREQLEQELFELHFGCHENPEAIEARLEREPALRELQAQMLSQAEVLEEAVRPEQPRLQLPRESEVAAAPIAARKPRWYHLPLGRLTMSAAAAAVFVLGFFVYERVAKMRLESYRSEHLHLTVSAPKAVPSGAPWSFTVQAQDLHGAPAACKVRWQAFDDGGSTLAANEAAVTDGNATISLPAALKVPSRVEVVCSTASDEVRQLFELKTAAAGPLVHVSTDRPVYKPGEPVFVRAVVLDRVTRLPLKRPLQITAQLRDAKDAPLGSDYEQATPGGVSSFRLNVPQHSAGGTHKVVIASNNGSFADETVEIVVRAFRNPQLKKDVVLDRKSYAPGARGSARVTSIRLANDTPSSGGIARGALIVDGEEVWNEERGLGADGGATFRFEVPKNVDKGQARFVATITDAGIVETEIEPFVVPTGEVLVAAFPEGGELIAGVENGLYLECSDPLGRPIDSAGELIDERDNRVMRFRTAHQGRAKIAFVPEAGKRYRVRLAGKEQTFPLPQIRDRGIALRMLDENIAAGQPLRMAAAGRGAGPWVLGVFCRGVLVGQTTLRGDASGELRTTSEVDLPNSAAGVLRATIFDRNLRPIAERLVQRQAVERLDVAVTTKHAVRAPGEAQVVNVRTTDETGAPKRAIVGLRCTDDAATSLGAEPRVGLEEHAMLFSDVERTEDLGDFFLAHAGSARNVDLLLGTRGWRRFVWRNDDAAKAMIAKQGDAADGILAREGFSQTPQVRSNLKAANAPMMPLADAAYQAGRRFKDVAMFALVVMLLLLSIEGATQLFRRFSDTRHWSQWLKATAAVAGLLLLVTLTMFNSIGDSAPAAEIAENAAVMPMDFEGDAAFDQLAPEPLPTTATIYTGLTAADMAHLGGHVDFFGTVYGLDNVGFQLQNGVPIAVGTNPVAMDPAAMPLAGEFFNDGREGDIRGRAELDLVRRFAALEDDAMPLYFLPWQDANEGKLNLAATAGRTLDGYIANWQGQWQQRQYAHQHQPSEERRDFTSTIFWNTLLITDADGRANVSFSTSDAVTRWRVEADAHLASGETGRVGQGETTFTTQLPLQIEPKLPVEVSAGDHLEIPIACVLKDAKIGEVKLTTEVGAGLRLGADAPTKIELDNEGDTAGRGRVLLPIDVDNTVGEASITITARAGRFVDTVTHKVAIAPRGFPHQRSSGGTITAATPGIWKLTIPRASAEDSGHATLKVYPSPVAALTEGLEGILREPHGCFEQASSSNYPNTMVLNLVQASGDCVPTITSRARDLLPRGYAKITGYECEKKGYEWFGHDPGHEALTAYGLLQFVDMAKVYDDVDMDMVARTRQWLLDRRDDNGGYRLNKKAIDRFGGASQRLTDAYVTYALLQAGTDAKTLEKEIDLLASRITTDDAYELALIACALHLAERPEAAVARKSLVGLQKDDGSLHGTTTSITSSGGRDLIVETTGFAVLAWLVDEQFAGNVHQAIEYLQSSRKGNGTFGATQATIVALQAITKYAIAKRTMRKDGTLRIYEDDTLIAEHAFKADDTGAIEFDLWDKLAAGDHTLRLQVEGGGEATLPWSGEIHYHAETPADDMDTATTISTSLRKQTAKEGETVALDVVVTNATDKEQPTPMAIVGIPAGLELPTAILDDMKKADKFAYWELKGRELILYWRKLDAKQRCELTFDLVAKIPGDTSGPASRTYLYYTPDQKRWAQPLKIEVEAR